MWLYSQQSGELFDRFGAKVAIGYSGGDQGKNNPAMQGMSNVGPIPCGIYTILAPVNTIKHGPYAMALVPDRDNIMFGRSDFMIHGDSLENPGHASEGCIIMPITTRVEIVSSGDTLLKVVPNVTPAGVINTFIQ